MHGGNFHGQPVAMALDQLKTGLVEIGVIGRAPHRARCSTRALSGGLPPFLIRGDAGLHSGFMGLQYCATTLAAENGAARRAGQRRARFRPTPTIRTSSAWACSPPATPPASSTTLRGMVAIELLCAAQALDLRGVAQAGAGTRAAYDAIRRVAAPLADDRGLRDDVEAVAQLIDSGALVAAATSP